jgi:hypothetical protein
MKTDSDETAMNLTAGHRPEAYSPECVEGNSVLKTLLVLAFARDRLPNTPVLGRFWPDLWSLSAQCRLFQQARKFCELRVARL